MTNEEIVAAIQAGDMGQVTQLWNQVERFIRLKAHRYTVAFNLDTALQEDLYQSGFLAMYDAAITFDCTAGAGFLAWLALYLKTAFREAMGIRSTRQKNDPIHSAISLDMPPRDADEDIKLSDTISAPSQWPSVEDRIWQEQAHDVIEAVLRELPPVQVEILHRKYYDRQTQEDIAAALNLNACTVRQEEEKAMRVLRHGRRSLILRALLDGPLPCCYQKVGAAQFNRTGESAVEVAVFRRERLATSKLNKQ